ncbi:DUF2868 domain-containing protein [Piscinibacter sp. XHJ-5]|uniref:DUF2868 domain-containing protein n=1 Tax=Piscinibacter sp. XHJ-5 TaxID=3037797 RepID=UPI00245281E8|nr:DUF2868 domain-containing protein [Piscinibacter sp. XHJ-5]
MPCLPESDARDVLLVRAFESPFEAPWSDADAAWASREAQRLEGEGALPERFLARRARLAVERLADRGIATGSPISFAWRWLAVPGAFALGVFSDSVAATERINILAPPLLGLLVWNLLVYAALALAALKRSAAEPGPLRGWLVGWARRATHAAGRSPPLARFAADWARVSQPLLGARIAVVLHVCAAALALGALASLYARGLVFEYRAGWDSTFLSPSAVQRILELVLGPASQWSGMPLPDAHELARLRFSHGGGENAARWIHLHAITLAAVVLLPRLVLAATAAWRARRLAAGLPLPLDDAYFRRLLQARSGQAVAVQVLPYSYHPGPELRPGLRAALERRLGSVVRLDIAEPVALGDEDGLRLDGIAGSIPVALFSLTATPERENHGAFVRALAALRRGLVVLVDESGFRRRFDGGELAERLAQRRSAWQRMLQDEGQTAEFVDLARP